MSPKLLRRLLIGLGAALLAASSALIGAWEGARWVRTHVGPVRLSYDRWDADVACVYLSVEQGLARLGPAFGALLPRPSDLILLQDHDSLQRAVGAALCPTTVAASLNGHSLYVQLPSSWPLDVKQTSDPVTLLTHEMTHLAVTHESAGRAPTWLQEGVAVYVSGEYNPAVLAGADVSAASLEAVEGCLMCPESSAYERSLAYQLAGGFIWCLVREAGTEEAIHRLLQALARGDSLEPAMRAAAGRGVTEMEERWRASLAGDVKRAVSRRGNLGQGSLPSRREAGIAPGLEK